MFRKSPVKFSQSAPFPWQENLLVPSRKRWRNGKSQDPVDTWGYLDIWICQPLTGFAKLPKVNILTPPVFSMRLVTSLHCHHSPKKNMFLSDWIYIYTYIVCPSILCSRYLQLYHKKNWLQGVASRHSSKLTTTPTKLPLPLSSSPWTNPETDCEDSNEFSEKIWSLDRLSQGRRVRSWAETAVRIHWCYVISSTSDAVTLIKISQEWTFKTCIHNS